MNLQTIAGPRCPNCKGDVIYRDSASPWIFVLAALLFPVGLIFFLFNRNVVCARCGTRFRKP